VKVTWSALAERRALEAVDYIAQDRPRAAAAWLEELIERVGDLDQFARRGRVVPEIGLSAYREILHAPYRVIYRVDASRVLILTLRHSRRAWDPSEVADGP
jgi:toxin ParE1/3/4